MEKIRKKSPPPQKKKKKKKKFFYLFSMQLFSVDALKNIKKLPSKVAHNRPQN